MSGLFVRFLMVRRKAVSTVDYAVLTGLVAVAVLGAVVLTGDRVRSLFVASETTVGDGVAGLPLPEPPGGGGGAGGGSSPPPPAPGQGAWSGDGTFLLDPGTTPQSRTFTLTNVGGEALALGGAPAVAGPGASFFQVLSTTCGASLAPGAACDVLLEASAAADGAASATLAVPGVPGGVPLARTAAGFVPLLAWSGGGPFAIDGTPPASGPFTAQQTFTLTNTGFADATGVAPAIAGPDAPAFSLSTTCPPILPQGDACAVTVTAAATANGALAATLSAGGPASADQPLAATATGFAPLFAWSGGGPLALTSPTSNPQAVSQVFTLANVGTAPGAPPTVSVSGDAAGYTLAVDAPACAASLPVGGTCAVTVTATFTGDVPTLAGILAAGPLSQPLAGSASGFTPALAFTASDGASLDATALPGPTRTYTLTNTGVGVAQALTFSFTGAAAADYERAGGSCVAGGDLAPGASCTVGIRLRDQPPAGLRTLTAGLSAATAAGPSATAASGAFTGIHTPCVPGEVAYTGFSSGTFTPTANSVGCRFRIALVGGGGGGGGSHADSGLAGGGGGSGYLTVLAFAPGALTTPQTFSVGAGGAGGPAASNGGAGGTTTFGVHSAAGGTGGRHGNIANNPIWGHGGGGGSTGGASGFAGGSNGGSSGPFVGSAPQGVPLLTSGFVTRTLSAGTGGAPAGGTPSGPFPNESYRGGGGGGGILLSGFSASGLPGTIVAVSFTGDSWVVTPSQGGQGFGAGGGGGSRSLGAGGNGRDGLIYIEWVTP